MSAQLPLAMALLGLASGVHCVGMCGGIVGAFSAQKKIALNTVRPEWQRQLVFNLGRVSSYAALGALALTAAMSASALDGALAMAAFGIGTLPNLFAAGLAAARIRTWFKRQAVRTCAGVAVLAFGAYGLAHASGAAEAIRRSILCL